MKDYWLREKEVKGQGPGPHMGLVIFKLITCDLTSVILIVVGTVNYQFQEPFFPIFFGSQFLELQQLMS